MRCRDVARAPDRAPEAFAQDFAAAAPGACLVVDPARDRVLAANAPAAALFGAPALAASAGRVSGAGGAAEILGLKPSTLYSRLRRLGLRSKTSLGRESGG